MTGGTTESIGLTGKAMGETRAEGRSPELLGLPCAPAEIGLQQYVGKFALRLEKRTAAISLVRKTDPYVVYLLQRMCAGFAASVHLARSRGVLEAFKHIGVIGVINAMDSYCPLGHDEAALARLPFRRFQRLSCFHPSG